MNLSALAFAAVLLAAGPAGAVGFQWGTAPDPEDRPIAVAIWYPSDATPRQEAGLFPQIVARDGRVTGAHLPLIILSHGTMGSPMNYCDTAISLVNAGFVVAGIVHTGDNHDDQKNAFSQRNFVGRPRHVSRMIDYMLGGWAGHGALDPDRIGILGHSDGGTTAFLASGGRLDPGRVLDYCRDNPEDWGCRAGRQRGEATDWNKSTPAFTGRDPRIKAAVLAAPALAHSWLPGTQDIPVQLWVGASDTIVPDAQAARSVLPGANYHFVADAGHFAYFVPCNDALAELAPEISVDPAGFDRKSFLRGFQQTLIAFFLDHLRP